MICLSNLIKADYVAVSTAYKLRTPGAEYAEEKEQEKKALNGASRAKPRPSFPDAVRSGNFFGDFFVFFREKA